MVLCWFLVIILKPTYIQFEILALFKISKILTNNEMIFLNQD